jgi:hypothetical protein
MVWYDDLKGAVGAAVRPLWEEVGLPILQTPAAQFGLKVFGTLTRPLSLPSE